jgi:putative Holliday junction resolvase
MALSDVTRTVATPYETLKRTKFTADAKRIAEIIEKDGVGGLVIGLPLNLDGSEGPRAQSTRAFARNLAAHVPIPMAFWDERLSTAAVERHLIEADASRKRRAEVIDRMAAAYILQGALDRLRVLAGT